MTNIRLPQLRPLAAACALLLTPVIAHAQAQMPAMPAQQAAPPSAGGMPGMNDASMQHGMQMSPPTAGMPMDKPMCCPKMKKAKSAPRHTTRHRRHARPAPMKPTPMPADKPMPMEGDM